MFIRRSERVQRDGQSLGLWLRVPVFALLGGRMRIRIWGPISSRSAEWRAHRAAWKRRKISHIGKERGSLLRKGVCEVSYTSTSPRWNRRLLRQRVARPTCVCGGSRHSEQCFLIAAVRTANNATVNRNIKELSGTHVAWA